MTTLAPSSPRPASKPLHPDQVLPLVPALHDAPLNTPPQAHAPRSTLPIPDRVTTREFFAHGYWKKSWSSVAFFTIGKPPRPRR